jgi:hypothetical protein
MNLDLGSTLRHSSELHAELDDLWSGLALPQSKRGQVVVGFCSIVREHVVSSSICACRRSLSQAAGLVLNLKRDVFYAEFFVEL